MKVGVIVHPAPSSFGRRGVPALALLALCLAGCALGPDFRRPDAPAGDRVVDTPSPDTLQVQGAGQRFDRGTDVPGRWWTLLGSEGIDRQVTEALARSPTVAAARATLHQSEDDLRAGYGVFYPQVGASLTAARQSSVTVLNHAPVSSGAYSLGTAAATVSYVPDLFGAQRRTVEALGAGVDEQRGNLQAAYLSLTANVVNAAIARAGYQAQRDALGEIIRIQADQVRIAEVQFQAGTAAYTAVVALRSQQAANEASAAALEQRIDQSDHLLAMLAGRTPAAAAPLRIPLDQLQLPPDLPEAVPSQLARHRPDIAIAEAQLHRASAQIGIATADLFPTLTLGGTGGASHAALADLLRSGTTFWSLQAQLAGSVFAGGAQWYGRRAAIDAYDASLAGYEQAVLAALDQVADTITALGHDAQSLRAQAAAQSAAAEALRLARINYEAGTAGYLELLSADTQYQQARLAYLGALAQRLQDTVALYAALGGGWWNREGS